MTPDKLLNCTLLSERGDGDCERVIYIVKYFKKSKNLQLSIRDKR